MNCVLVTGVAGFIGYHTANRLLQMGIRVVGIDNLNPYYSVALKKDRLSQLYSLTRHCEIQSELTSRSNAPRGTRATGSFAIYGPQGAWGTRNDDELFSFFEFDLRDREKISQLFFQFNFDTVIHLAAQAGVRYSLENPHVYVDSNVVGFLNILEGCRQTKVKHLVYASSSSVYGLNTQKPFSVSHNVDHPISLYAATKKANELMAHTYSYLYALPTTGLRFFTVYGPWGRPDMAIFKFTKALLEGDPIDVYNQGQMMRDFTYIDDVVEGVVRVCEHIPTSDPSWNSVEGKTGRSSAPYALYNIGNHQPVNLEDLITILEKTLKVKARKHYLPLQPGDVPVTYADVDDLMQAVGFKPTTPLEVGIERFVGWYQAYYQSVCS